MTDKELIRAEIERKRASYFGNATTFTIAQKMVLTELLSFIDSMEEEPVSEDLEKAAIKYAQDKYMPVQTSQAFKAGAQWCKQQMMKKAMDVRIDSSRSDGKTILSGNFFKYNTGDKVKIIIVKED